MGIKRGIHPKSMTRLITSCVFLQSQMSDKIAMMHMTVIAILVAMVGIVMFLLIYLHHLSNIFDSYCEVIVEGIFASKSHKYFEEEDEYYWYSFTIWAAH